MRKVNLSLRKLGSQSNIRSVRNSDGPPAILGASTKPLKVRELPSDVRACSAVQRGSCPYSFSNSWPVWWAFAPLAPRDAFMSNVEDFPVSARRQSTEFEALVAAGHAALEAIPGAVWVGEACADYIEQPLRGWQVR